MIRRWERSLGLLLLLAFFAQGMVQIQSMSLTFDEGPHLATGYATLLTGDFRLQPVHIHPPLANVLAAAPLLLQDDLPDPRAIDGWDIASLSAITDGVVWQYPHPERLALVGRLPILWLAVLLGAVISRWARDFGGPGAALPALTLFAFDPNIIAHGTLITTDLAATFFVTVTLYAATRISISETRNFISEKTHRQESHETQKWIMVGVLLGLALLTKVSTLLLVPVLLLLIAAQLWKTRSNRVPHDRPLVAQFLKQALSIGIPAALTVWAGYGFEIGPVSGLPFSIPAATHFRIYQALQKHYTLGHPTYLLGQVSSHGWWTYFPIAFLLKTPLPVLIAALCSAIRTAIGFLQRVAVAPQGASGGWRAAIASKTYPRLALFVFPIAYAATSLFSTVNIGYRHLLPLLPFLYIGIAQFPMGVHKHTPGESRPVRSKVARLAQGGLLIWLISGTVTIAPDFLAFFNELAGGPAGGYRFLVDSNLDWGQNLWQLRDWMLAHGHDQVYYAHFSPARPQVYGINAVFLPPDPRAIGFAPWQPAPGLYAIGSTVLQGPYAPDINYYAWFRTRTPIARLGHALWLYEVFPSSSPKWAVLCPDAGLSPEQVRGNLGQPALRVLQPDCDTADVYAKGPGILIGSAAPLKGQLDFELKAANGDNDVGVYQMETAPTPNHPYLVMTHGPADFLGFDVLENPDSPEVLVRAYWRIKEKPARPLSLMAHSVATDGTTWAIGDGMGFPLDQWETGDFLVQYHRFAKPGAEGFAYRFGGYWLDTMERWVASDGRDFWEVSP